MTIIHRYLTREIIRFFCIILVLVVGIYLIVDFFERVDNFISRGVPLTRAFVFLALKIPFILAQILPVSTLLSVLIVFGLMKKNGEIIALKSSGVSVYYLARPVLVMGIGFFLANFLLSEVIVPVTQARANAIWLGEVKNKSAHLSGERNIWIRGDRAITHINYYHSGKKTIYGLTYNRFDPNFKLKQRIDAAIGVYQNDRWELFDLMVQNFEELTGKSTVTHLKSTVIDPGFLPEDLNKVVKRSEEMNYSELREFIRKVEAEGYDATPYRVDLNAKIAFPFVCIIMCLLGTGIATKGRAGEGLPVAVAYGILIAFLYWIFYSLCLSMGYGEMLPPAVAAWTANLIFLCWGVYTLVIAE